MQASKTHKFKVFAVTASEYTALQFIEGSCKNCTISYSLCQLMFLCIEKVNLKSDRQSTDREGRICTKVISIWGRNQDQQTWAFTFLWVPWLQLVPGDQFSCSTLQKSFVTNLLTLFPPVNSCAFFTPKLVAWHRFERIANTSWKHVTRFWISATREEFQIMAPHSSLPQIWGKTGTWKLSRYN